MAVPLFLNFATNLVSEWSTTRKPGRVDCKHFETIPLLSTQAWDSAYRFRTEKRAIMIEKSEKFNTYFVKSTIGIQRSGQIDEEQVERYKQQQRRLEFPTFDSFVIRNFDIIKVTIPNPLQLETLTNSTCTCTSFFKNNICKHILGIASLKSVYPESHLTIPIQSKNVDLTRKRGAGRPAKAKAALIRQKPTADIEPLEPIVPEQVEPTVEQEPEPIETEPVTTKKTTRKRKIQTEPVQRQQPKRTCHKK